MQRNNSFADVSYNNDIQYVTATILSNLTQAEIVCKRILDFGCGSGDAVSYFRKMGAAYMRFDLASSYGAKKGAEERDKLAGKLSPAEINEAKKMLKDWVGKLSAEKRPN